MGKIVPSLTTSVVLTVFVASATIAGPWPRKHGNVYVQLGFSTIGYNKVYNDNSSKSAIGPDVRDNVVQLLAEYGLLENVTLFVSIPFKHISVSNRVFLNDARVANIGDTDFGVRHNWLNENGVVLSGEIVLGLPTGKSNSQGGLYLGDGEFNTLVKILAGKSFYPIPAYARADAGFNFRTKAFSNDVQLNCEAGYSFVENCLYAILQISAKISTNNNPTFRPGGLPFDSDAHFLGLYTNNQEFTAIIPKLFYKIDEHWSLSFTYATAVHGRNVAGGAVIAGSVSVEW